MQLFLDSPFFTERSKKKFSISFGSFLLTFSIQALKFNFSPSGPDGQMILSSQSDSELRWWQDGFYERKF